MNWRHWSFSLVMFWGWFLIVLIGLTTDDDTLWIVGVICANVWLAANEVPRILARSIRETIRDYERSNA